MMYSVIYSSVVPDFFTVSLFVTLRKRHCVLHSGLLCDQRNKAGIWGTLVFLLVIVLFKLKESLIVHIENTVCVVEKVLSLEICPAFIDTLITFQALFCCN